MKFNVVINDFDDGGSGSAYGSFNGYSNIKQYTCSIYHADAVNNHFEWLLKKSLNESEISRLLSCIFGTDVLLGKTSSFSRELSLNLVVDLTDAEQTAIRLAFG